MKLSTRGKYGVRAMYEIALRGAGEPVPLKTIAANQGLSVHYLEQLIGPLREAGLVTSVRGARGGYMLGRPPEEITIAEIITLLEGPITPSDCVGDDGGHVEHCGCPDGCVARGIWERVREAVVGLLSSMTLADLLKQHDSIVGGCGNETGLS